MPAPASASPQAAARAVVHGLIASRHWPREQNDAYGAANDELVATMANLIDNAAARCHQIELDANLTPRGMLQAKVDVVAQARAKLADTVRRAVLDIDSRTVAARSRAGGDRLLNASDLAGTTWRLNALGEREAVPNVVDSFMAFDLANQLAATRTALLDAEPIRRATALRAAAADGDASVLYAAQTLPRWQQADIERSSVISLVELRRVFFETRDPASFGSLRLWESIGRRVAANVHAARAALERALGIGAAYPLPEVIDRDVREALQRLSGTTASTATLPTDADPPSALRTATGT